MNKLIKYCLLMVSVAFAAQSCKKDEDIPLKKQSKFIQVPITGVNGPTSGVMNEELRFDLSWANTDISTKLEAVSDSVVGNVHHVKLFARTNISDVVTTKPVVPMLYTFKADTSGVYLLKFYNSAGQSKRAIIDTIVIK